MIRMVAKLIGRLDPNDLLAKCGLEDHGRVCRGVPWCARTCNNGRSKPRPYMFERMKADRLNDILEEARKAVTNGGN